jgi:hypothetical protein
MLAGRGKAVGRAFVDFVFVCGWCGAECVVAL